MLLKKAMERNGWAETKFIIDGFPRNQDNYDGWYKVMGEIAEVPFLLFLDADQNTMKERITERGKSSGRNDDNLEVLQKRFDTFINETMPVVDIFDKNGRCKKVDANGTID